MRKNSINLCALRRLALSGLILLAAAIPDLAAQDSDLGDILIRNVVLIDPAGNVDDRKVNILVKDNELDIITEDSIPAREADHVLDANGGYIVGTLALGEAPSFMILSGDPRTNFEIMLDTQNSATFAIHNGRVVKNRLVYEPAPDPEDETGRSERVAYSPPPMAIPLSVEDNKKWNSFESKYVSGKIVSAAALDRTRWVHQDQASEDQVGDLATYDGGEVRAWRFGAIGTINVGERPWSWTILAETNAFGKGFETSNSDEWKVADWRLDIPVFRNSAIKLGRQKEPFSQERSQSILHNQMQERTSVTDALMRSRNVGVVWSGHSPEHYASWHIGAFNDWFIDGEDFSESDSQYIGRATWAPFRSEDGSNLVHLGASYRYSEAKEGFRLKAEPEFNKAPLYVDTGFGTETGTLPADNTKTWNLEASWRKGPFWLSSEYTQLNVDNPELGDPSFQGYWVAASWDLTGGMRSYRLNKGVFGYAPISRSVYQNGWGSWEVSTRFSHIDLEDGLVTGGEMDIVSLGLTWRLAGFFVFDVNYRYIWNELDGVKGTSGGWNTRVLLLLN